MPIFRIEQIHELQTIVPVWKLKRDGKCMVDDFWEEIKQDKILAGELDDLTSIVQDVANCHLVPKTSYKKLNLSSKLNILDMKQKARKKTFDYILFIKEA